MEQLKAQGGQRKTLISICIPVLNEEENVRRAYEAVVETFKALADQYTFEITFTDNRSSDRTFEIIREIAEADPRVHAVQFARNVGYQKSILAGYLLCHGDAAIQLDCDLQDPPGFIPYMIERWKEGYSVVYGIRAKRAERGLMTAMRKLFYRLIRSVATDDIPVDSGDFRLIDRCVIEVLRRSVDQAPYLRGLIAVTGMKQVGFRYERQAREAGSTKFRLAQLLRLSFDALTSQSVLPLQFATYLGLFLAVLVVVAMFAYLIVRFAAGGTWPDGFATLLFLQLVNLAVSSLFFGLLGEYVGRISRDVKKRPLVVVDSAIGFSKDEHARNDDILFVRDLI